MPTFTQAFDSSGSGIVKFSKEFAVYRRHITQGLPSFSVGGQVKFASQFAFYRRLKTTPETSFSIGVINTLFAREFFSLPRNHRIFSQATLIKVSGAPFILGDTGFEITLSIPPKLKDRPHLIAPKSGSSNRIASPIFIWTPVTGAVYYELHIYMDVSFTNRVARFDVLGTEFQSWINFGGTYYWKVRAVAPPMYSDFSETWIISAPALVPGKDFLHSEEGKSRLLNQFKGNG